MMIFSNSFQQSSAESSVIMLCATIYLFFYFFAVDITETEAIQESLKLVNSHLNNVLYMSTILYYILLAF